MQPCVFDPFAQGPVGAHFHGAVHDRMQPLQAAWLGDRGQALCNGPADQFQHVSLRIFTGNVMQLPDVEAAPGAAQKRHPGHAVCRVVQRTGDGHQVAHHRAWFRAHRSARLRIRCLV